MLRAHDEQMRGIGNPGRPGLVIGVAAEMAGDLIARRASAGGDITFFAVTDDASGQVVGAAWVICYPGTDVACLAGGSMLRAWRKRGICRALVAVRDVQAAARGALCVMVDASDGSSPILRGLGFTAVTTTTPYDAGRCQPGACRS